MSGLMTVTIRESGGGVLPMGIRVPLSETLDRIDADHGVPIDRQDDESEGEAIAETVVISETRQDAAGSLRQRLDAIDAKFFLG